MRIIVSVLVCLVLAGCGGSTSGGKKSLAVKFDQIEVGTIFIYENTDNRSRWMDRYDGVEKGLHVVRSYALGRNNKILGHRSTDYYDTMGRRVRIEDLSFNNTFVFTPFDCMTGTTGTCSHRRTLFDAQTGKKKSAPIKDFELSLSGNTLKVVRNAKSNRLRRTHTLNEANILTSQREPNPQFANNWKLIQTVTPAN